MTKSLCQLIGKVVIEACITEFYIRAFRDPIIGHFFFGSDLEHITRMQIRFAQSMLGCKEASYKGLSLDSAHQKFMIGGAHFGRRQTIMREVLVEFNVAPELIEAWLEREEALKPIILKTR